MHAIVIFLTVLHGFDIMKGDQDIIIEYQKVANRNNDPDYYDLSLKALNFEPEIQLDTFEPKSELAKRYPFYQELTSKEMD